MWNSSWEITDVSSTRTCWFWIIVFKKARAKWQRLWLVLIRWNAFPSTPLPLSLHCLSGMSEKRIWSQWHTDNQDTTKPSQINCKTSIDQTSKLFQQIQPLYTQNLFTTLDGLHEFKFCCFIQSLLACRCIFSHLCSSLLAGGTTNMAHNWAGK